MFRKTVLAAGVALIAAAAPVTALAATRAPAGPATSAVRVDCTGDQQRLQLRDGSGDGLQVRVSAPAGAAGYMTGPQDGTGLQHQGPALG